MTVSLDTQHNSVEFHYVECRYAECHDIYCYSECHYTNVIMLSVVMLNVIMLSVVAPCTSVDLLVPTCPEQLLLILKIFKYFLAKQASFMRGLVSICSLTDMKIVMKLKTVIR